MKIALLADAPHPHSKVTHTYQQRVIEACANAAGVDVDVLDVYAVPTEQPGGKAPPVALLRTERPGLFERVRSFDPDMIVTLGGAAMNAALNADTTLQLRKEHGRMRWVDISGKQYPLVPTVEPYRVVKKADLHRDFANVIYKSMTQPELLEPTDIETMVAWSHRDLVALSFDEKGMARAEKN